MSDIAETSLEEIANAVGAAPEAQYGLSFDPLSATTAQIAAVLNAFVFVVPESLYIKLAPNVQPLFRKVNGNPIRES